MMRTTTALRLIFGAWMLLNGANHFLGFYAEAPGQAPLAAQLMGAFVHSGLLDVAMAVQLVAGALVLAGLFVPVALAVLMPISACAVYWTVMLERDPMGAVLALAAFALNGLLMLAYLDYYRPMLARRALAIDESAEAGGNFEDQFLNPFGRTPRGAFIAAFIPLLLAVLLYTRVVPFFLGQWNLLPLILPFLVLVARRLNDLGKPTWLLLIPSAAIAAAIWLRATANGTPIQANSMLAAFVLCGAFALLGAAVPGKAGAPATT